MVRDEWPSESCQNADLLLDWDQLQSVVPGGKKGTEVTDILLKWMAGLQGVAKFRHILEEFRQNSDRI